MTLQLHSAVSAVAMYDSLHGVATPPCRGEYRRLASEPDHFAQFERKLDELKGPTGPWAARGWARPAASAIEAARDGVRVLRDLNLVPDGVLATAKGGVGIRFTRGRLYGSLEFLNSGDVVQLKMGRGSPTAIPVEIGPAGTRAAVEDLRLFLNS